MVTAWFNEAIVNTSTPLKAVDWVYLPAGVKILSILIARHYGAVGVVLANWTVSLTQWPGSHPAMLAVISLVWVSATYLAIVLMLKWNQIHTNLKGLRYSQLVVVVLGSSVITGLIYNAFLWALGERASHEYWPSVIAMALGDFMGTGILLALILLAAELKSRITW